jgi:hypothetical protein
MINLRFTPELFAIIRTNAAAGGSESACTWFG